MIEVHPLAHHADVRASSVPRPSAPPFDARRRARLAEMVARDYQLIWRLLRRLGLPAAAADDAAQQVFLIAAERLDDVQDGKERAFAYGTALRLAQTLRRHARREQTGLPEGGLEPRDAADDPERHTERMRAREQLDALLVRMPLELRSVFVLFELEGLTSPEIAALAELPLGTVASRIRRARALFRALLQRHGGQP